MLFRDAVPLTIVSKARRRFPQGDYEGLDASAELPPLLHPQMLMDLEGYGAWERHVVAVFARAARRSPRLPPSREMRARCWNGAPAGRRSRTRSRPLMTISVLVAESRWGGTTHAS